MINVLKIQLKKKTCCDVALNLGLDNFIITGNQKKKITKKDEKILSDCCEAIIGAIYVDRGFETSKKFILNAWKKYIDKSDVTVLDSKTKLQEYSLKKFKKLPVYRLINCIGPKHNPIYKVSVAITNSKTFFGTGHSKQQAEQDGANKLLLNKNLK